MVKKNFHFYFELWWPLILAIVLAISSLIMPNSFLKNNTNDLEKLFKIVASVSAITFGFLMTMLAILVNSSNYIMRFLKRSGKFKNISIYNKVAVYLAGILCLFSIFLAMSAKELVLNYFCYGKLMFVIWFATTVYFIGAIYRFLSLFFEIISHE